MSGHISKRSGGTQDKSRVGSPRSRNIKGITGKTQRHILLKEEDFMEPRTRNTQEFPRPDAASKFKMFSKAGIGMRGKIPSQNLTNLLTDLGTHITSENASSELSGGLSSKGRFNVEGYDSRNKTHARN